jgi:DNA-binding response OmpR family regulator
MAARVLVIDDSPMTVQLVTAALAQAGIAAAAATDLAALDAVLAQGAYDVVLVDVNMPEMFGDDVVEFLRVQRRLTSKLVLYSDLSEDELSARAARAGADGFLSKARGLEATVSAIQALLPAEAPAPGQRRVLLVDGRRALPATLPGELAARGLEVSAVDSGDAATRAILKKRTRPDLVLVDVATPGLDAVEFCRLIAGNSLFAGIRVLMCAPGADDRLQPLAGQAPSAGVLREHELNANELLRRLA